MRLITLQTLQILALASTFALSTAAAPVRPKVVVTILQPKADDVLSGTTAVRLRFEPEAGVPMPARAMTGIGGAPWVNLIKQSNGDWTAMLDTTMAPNGPQKLLVATDQRYGRGALNIVVTNELRCFFADLHSHTSYSDGTMTPEAAHDYAKNVSKLDVFALTDHLESVTDDEWMDIRQQAERANEDGAFVTFPALEWTKRFGHTCIFDPKTRIWPTELDAFYKTAAEAGVIVKFNHAGAGTNVFRGMAYSEDGDKAVELIEVRSEQEELGYIRALDQGWHLAPDGSDDTHASNWGSRYLTGIWAPGLSRKNIWEALKNRRCFSTHDRNCRLQFTANGLPMGSILSEPVETLALSVTVEDPDLDDRTARITLYQDGKIVASHDADTSRANWSSRVKVSPGAHYWFVKVTQADRNTLWSAPVWATGKGND